MNVYYSSGVANGLKLVYCEIRDTCTDSLSVTGEMRARLVVNNVYGSLTVG